jgi:hypothetical protein
LTDRLEPLRPGGSHALCLHATGAEDLVPEGDDSAGILSGDERVIVLSGCSRTARRFA